MGCRSPRVGSWFVLCNIPWHRDAKLLECVLVKFIPRISWQNDLPIPGWLRPVLIQPTKQTYKPNNKIIMQRPSRCLKSRWSCSRSVSEEKVPTVSKSMSERLRPTNEFCHALVNCGSLYLHPTWIPLMSYAQCLCLLWVKKHTDLAPVHLIQCKPHSHAHQRDYNSV